LHGGQEIRTACEPSDSQVTRDGFTASVNARKQLAARPAEQCTVRAILGCFLGETLRMDLEIDRAHRELFGW
jgi:hypothetical protein